MMPEQRHIEIWRHRDIFHEQRKGAIIGVERGRGRYQGREEGEGKYNLGEVEKNVLVEKQKESQEEKTNVKCHD